MDKGGPATSSQSGKGRFSVTLYIPSAESSEIQLIIPHPWTATLASLRESALIRAARLGFALPNSADQPVAHLGSALGGILFDEDVLGEIIFEREQVWFVFPEVEGIGGKRLRAGSITDNESEGVKKRRVDGEADQSRPEIPAFILRIVTPELAKRRNRIEDIEPLPERYGVTRETTFANLKKIIGEYAFGFTDISSLATDEHGQGDCNCLMAQKVVRCGTREHVQFPDGRKITARTEGENCHIICQLCSKPLADLCPGCVGAGEAGTVQCGFLTHVDCLHVFHQHCAEKVDNTDRCPLKNAAHINCLNREYMPLDETNFFLVVIYGRTTIQKVALPPTAVSSASPGQKISVTVLAAHLKTIYGPHCNLSDKVATVYGATVISTDDSDSPQSSTGRQIIFNYSCVISICSRTKHPLAAGAQSPTVIDLFDILPPRDNPTGTETDATALRGVQYDIDIHTGDAPIVCTDEQTPLGGLHLDESAVGGVVNLFVTARVRSGDSKLTSGDDEEASGMDWMFTDRDHWRLPLVQTERGMANFLSSTRVFASRIAKADATNQNSILALLMHLTHFPPILRSLHTLMSGKTLSPAESAVLVQCVYELTKELITPGRAIGDINGRVLEGSRLLYYIALELAREFHRPNATEYLDAMKVIELIDAETFQPLANPVVTNIGLLEAGYFDALSEGMLKGLGNVARRTPNDEELKILKLVQRTGGTMSRITIFETDILQLIRAGQLKDPNAGDSIATIDSAAFGCPRVLNFNFKELCLQSSMGTFAVVPPMHLRSASVQAPALTLDGEGLLAVYVGRPPCAPPDQDVSIFRPTRGGEVSIDVSLITQLLEPILEQRTTDGSISLDSLGEAEGKAINPPNEIIVLCVDCSTSMRGPAGFEGVNEVDESEDSEEGSDDDANCDDIGEQTESTYSLEEGQAILSGHESFRDILNVIRGKMWEWDKVKVATNALTYIIEMQKAELKVLKSERRRIEKLEQYTGCLSNMNDAKLAQFLVQSASKPLGAVESSRGQNESIQPQPSIDSVRSISTGPINELKLPLEFQCPISLELFDTPVVAEDGFTYERLQIDKWFETTQTSPMTGLNMGTVLLLNRNLATQIREWREGVDIIKAETGLQQVPSRWKGSATVKLVKVQILSQTNSWHFRLPTKMRERSLRALCFRCLRGDTVSFRMMHNGSLVTTEWDATLVALTVTLKENMSISIIRDTVSPATAPAISTTPSRSAKSERVLVKVYNGHSETHRQAPALKFWILTSTQSTVGSILFRHWASTTGTRTKAPNTHEIWTRMSYSGDGVVSGVPLQAWKALSEVIALYAKSGTTDDADVLYEKVVDDAKCHDWEGTDREAKVLKVIIHQQTKGKKSKNKDTRMDVVKQIFDNYINRTLAYDFPNHIGLITFATKPTIKQPITGVVENLRSALEKIDSGGDTALWDALNLAHECIKTYSAQYTEAKKRIVCLSDGVDTTSKALTWKLCQQFQDDNIIVDSISIGDENNKDLRALSYGTGGYKFHPQELENAVAICELETVLSQGERPQTEPVFPLLSKTKNIQREFLKYTHMAKIDIVNEDTYPARKPHPNLEDEFVAISAMFKKGATGNRSNAGIKLGEARLLQEMRMIASNNQPFYDVYASESNMRFWKVIMEAPRDSTYAGGTYLLYLDMDANYPRSAPKARFVTPIIHPNINKHGRICHSIVDRDWTSDITLGTLLNVIWSLLLVPNKEDFANVVTSLNYMWDEVGYQERVREHVKKHATKSRVEWRVEVLGEEV